MDNIDKAILERLQYDFPLVSRPFSAIAERLGLAEEHVLGRIGSQLENGLLRRVGGVFSRERLGMASTLVAVHVDDEDSVDRVADTISRHPEITHNYGRRHYYNLWFTIVAGNVERLRDILDEVRALEGVAELREFPTKKTFKIDARFRVQGE